ncbi:MAG: ABC transporter permease, partial [Thermoanaerobaculia bacterium]
MKRPSASLWLGSLVLYAFLWAPIVVVVVFSFNAARYGGPWQGFTTQWYGTLLASEEKLDAAKNTLILGAASTLLATVLGTMLGYGLSRYRFRGKKFFSWLMYIPVVIPDIVMAVAMLMFYALVRDR